MASKMLGSVWALGLDVKASTAMTEDCRCFLTGVLIRCVRNFQIRWERQAERAWYMILSLVTQREAYGCSQEDSLSSQYSPEQLRDLKGNVNNGLSSMTNVNPGNVCPPPLPLSPSSTPCPRSWECYAAHTTLEPSMSACRMLRSQEWDTMYGFRLFVVLGTEQGF